MKGLERIWAGWRMPYLEGAPSGAAGSDPCVFCGLLDGSGDDEERYILWRGPTCFAVLNVFPYTSGHLMVLPQRHVDEPASLTEQEARELWSAVLDAMEALRREYHPEGVNLGANLGRAAGAGIPGHFHMHVLGRWSGDSNFVTTVAEARVLPEALTATWRRLTRAWPSS